MYDGHVRSMPIVFIKGVSTEMLANIKKMIKRYLRVVRDISIRLQSVWETI